MRMKRPIVYVRDWRTGQTVTIHPWDPRTADWAVNLVLADQRARETEAY